MNSLKKKSTPYQIQGKKHSVKKKKLVTFRYYGKVENNVYVAGTFNNWHPTKNKLKEKNSGYSLKMHLPKGKYEYKFIVDDAWTIDPNCREWILNSFGSLNSLLNVK